MRTVPRQPVRVLPQRRARRPQLLRRSAEAPVEAEHLRRLAGRADRQGQDVLLRRFPGQQHPRRADDPADGADGADAPGRLHRVVSWGARGDDLRPGQHPTGPRDRPARPRRLPNNTIPADRIDPIGKALLDLLPLPTFTDRLAGNYLANPVKTLDDYQGDVRVDHNFSNDDRLFGRFSFEEAEQYCRPVCRTSARPAGSPAIRRSRPAPQHRGVADTIFSSNVINQFTAGYNRVFNYIYVVRLSLEQVAASSGSRAPTSAPMRLRR